MLNKKFSALADANRQKILNILKRGEMPVAQIAEKLDITLATISHHLDILKKVNLISGRRDGQQILYSLNLSALDELSKEVINLLAIKPKKKL